MFKKKIIATNTKPDDDAYRDSVEFLMNSNLHKLKL